MLRTASIRLNVTCAEAAALHALRTAYADACNRLVPIVREHRCWNRVGLHNHAYSRLRAETPLGSQMACNAIYGVCKAYKAQKALGRISKDAVPLVRFARGSVHYDKRTYTLKADALSLNTLEGRIRVALSAGEHQQRRDLDVTELAMGLQSLDELHRPGHVDRDPLGDVGSAERGRDHRLRHHLAHALDRLAPVTLYRLVRRLRRYGNVSA